MDIRFVVEKGRSKRHVLHMVGTHMIVGRQYGCGIRVTSAEVSRQHCRLTIQEGFLWVQDLHSSNGTYLNDEEVVGREVVRPGDRLQVGPVTFVVEYELDQAALNRLARRARPSLPPSDYDFLDESAAEEGSPV